MFARFTAVALLSCAASTAAAQGTPRVPVSGRVIDGTTSHGVAAASVELTNETGDTVRVRSTANGSWQGFVMASSRYTARVRALGFQTRAFMIADAASAHELVLVPLALELDRMVVTAARREQRLADVVATTELVSAADIARTGASDLGAALAAASGIQLEGGTPAGTGVMLQGMGSARVLILLDGQPMPGRIAGEFDVSRIPTAMIERVEIVKGPQSSLYGTDAMGGVVNIITKRAIPGERFASASILAGSRDRRDGSVAIGSSLGPVAVRLEGGRRSIAGTPGRAEARGALAERTDVSANAQWQAGAKTTIDVGVLALDERQRWLSGSLFTFGDNLQVSARTSATHTLGSGGSLRATAFGSWYDHLSRASVQPQPIRGDTGQRQDQRLAQLELAYTQPWRAHTLDAGVSLRHDDTRSARIPGGRRALMTVEPSLQLEATLTPALTVVTGGRMSMSERWGTHFTPRVAMRYGVTDAITLRASAGSGFRAPDFRELYMQFQNESAGYAVYGNEDLVPERSTNVTAGVEVAADRGYFRGQLFHNEFRGFIEAQLVSAADQTYKYANVDDGYTRGVELEGASTLALLRIDAAY
ncbi:MAG TPA: TonB-dependent receptor, partial [Gemmatimonadaceae bacterium]|nr:TonB-dependent receptor [Gemmatimonadaceae bacterium]